MERTPDPHLIAEQMLVADTLLAAYGRGGMTVHPTAYRELARWVRASFESVDSAALRVLRDAAPLELREIAENVLHQRRVVSWASDDRVGLSALGECLGLLARCRGRGGRVGRMQGG